jgi:sulfite reductase (ferredoxin)
MSTEAAPAVPKPSPVEGIKEESRYLRGTLAAELAGPSDHFSEQAKQLVKFHGSYQQEDRDARKNRAKTGVTGKAYMFMIRLKLPGGKLTADQYLRLDELADKYANGTLRVTTRQSIQFHGVLKGNLRATIQGFNDALMTSLGGCGDVNRNVLACPAPTGDPVRVECQRLADEIAAHLAPRAGARAYHEIWLNGEPQEVPAAEHENPEHFEPVYGRHYLPRKFKVAFALPDDNCTDLLAQCLGLLAVAENGKPVGYDLYAGGGQGLTNSKPDTFACLAQPVGFVHANEVVAAAEGVCKLFRDHGNRSDRKRARLKYVMADWGVEKFRDVFYRDYFTGPRRPPTGTPITGLDLHHGWHPQADGRWFLGLSVENGRIKDEGDLQLRTALREIVRRVRCDVRLTAQQDVLLANVATADRGTVDALLSEHGVHRADALSMVQRWSLACPAVPTCPLAISESERALPGVVDQLEAALAELGLGGEPISVRMTGCPNGCARPYQSEVGIVGRSGDKYTLYIGGDSFGRRLNAELQDLVPRGEIVPKLRAVFGTFRDERRPGEAFGDYCERVGVERLKAAIA